MIFNHPCSTEGANRWRLLAERDAAPEGSVSSTEPPGALGATARPNYMGPSGNGLVGSDERRAKNLRNQGRSDWPPLSGSRRRSWGLRKNAAVERREARRHALWAGNPVR